MDNLDVIISTTDGTSRTEFKSINVYKLISYLTKKFPKSLAKNVEEGTKVLGKHNPSKRPKQINETNDNM